MFLENILKFLVVCVLVFGIFSALKFTDYLIKGETEAVIRFVKKIYIPAIVIWVVIFFMTIVCSVVFKF